MQLGSTLKFKSVLSSILSFSSAQNRLISDSVNLLKYLNINTNLSLHSCWINKVLYYTDEDIKNNLLFDEDFQTYTDNYVHTHDKLEIISCIFYLQNPDKKYGTLVETKNNILVLD